MRQQQASAVWRMQDTQPRAGFKCVHPAALGGISAASMATSTAPSLFARNDKYELLTRDQVAELFGPAEAEAFELTFQHLQGPFETATYQQAASSADLQAITTSTLATSCDFTSPHLAGKGLAQNSTSDATPTVQAPQHSPHDSSDLNGASSAEHSASARAADRAAVAAAATLRSPTLARQGSARSPAGLTPVGSAGRNGARRSNAEAEQQAGHKPAGAPGLRHSLEAGEQAAANGHIGAPPAADGAGAAVLAPVAEHDEGAPDSPSTAYKAPEPPQTLLQSPGIATISSSLVGKHPVAASHAPEDSGAPKSAVEYTTSIRHKWGDAQPAAQRQRSGTQRRLSAAGQAASSSAARATGDGGGRDTARVPGAQMPCARPYAASARDVFDSVTSETGSAGSATDAQQRALRTQQKSFGTMCQTAQDNAQFVASSMDSDQVERVSSSGNQADASQQSSNGAQREAGSASGGVHAGAPGLAAAAAPQQGGAAPARPKGMTVAELLGELVLHELPAGSDANTLLEALTDWDSVQQSLERQHA